MWDGKGVVGYPFKEIETLTSALGNAEDRVRGWNKRTVPNAEKILQNLWAVALETQGWDRSGATIEYRTTGLRIHPIPSF